MPAATQFCVGLDNQPGMLSELCELMTEAKVNIEALCVAMEKHRASPTVARS